MIYGTTTTRSLHRFLIVFLLTAGLSGCGSGVGSLSGGTNGIIVDGNRDETITSPIGKTDNEPNDTLAEAIVAVFDENDVAGLQGTVQVEGDIDVFLLGSLNAGDQLTITTTTPGSVLDVSVAVFDSQSHVVYVNDDVSSNNFDSYLQWIVRRDNDAYYLAITNSAFAGPGQDKGSYQVDIVVNRGLEVPIATRQIVVIDFDGGTINDAPLGPTTIPAFDADQISPIYSGQTEQLKGFIRDSVARNFERFNVEVLTSDNPPSSTTEVTTIFMGGFSPTMFGIADAVDLYNADFCDDAIIFAESFKPQIFSTAPSLVDLAEAIGNVTAHEAGHLLGLSHVDDDTAIMDDRSAADAFLADQEFKNAPLSRDIMELGTQDAVMLLADIVGLVGN